MRVVHCWGRPWIKSSLLGGRAGVRAADCKKQKTNIRVMSKQGKTSVANRGARRRARRKRRRRRGAAGLVCHICVFFFFLWSSVCGFFGLRLFCDAFGPRYESSVGFGHNVTLDHGKLDQDWFAEEGVPLQLDQCPLRIVQLLKNDKSLPSRFQGLLCMHIQHLHTHACN